MSRADRIVARKAWAIDCPAVFNRTRKNKTELYRILGEKVQPGAQVKPMRQPLRRTTFEMWKRGH